MANQPPTYQHFVPQFLLKNFAHPCSDPNVGSKASKRSRGRKQGKGKPFPGDPVVYHVNLKADPLELTESPVKRILGQLDMYRDVNKPSDGQQHIEEMFAKLESKASTAFRRITKAFEAGEPAVCLTRDERNLIRKFLFLLKYRGSGFHRRFYHVDMQEYYEDDTPVLRDYMEAKGFTRPFDVWLSNLKAIIDLKMDAEGLWRTEIVKMMYPEDAMWFIAHVQCSYMAICTPSPNSTQEFILTDNCYNVFEGPNALARDIYTGMVRETMHANLHEFAPISPKLMLVLRSFIFPLPEEDASPATKMQRDEFRKEIIDQTFGPEAWSNSPLVGLPIHKAHNSYSTFINGRVRLREGEDGKFKPQDRFVFPFFPINRHHINTINGIFLDETRRSTSIIFASQSIFFNTLETYLTSSSYTGKRVTNEDGDLRLQMLQKFSALLKTMGSTKQPVWNVISVDQTIDYDGLIGYHTGLIRWWKNIAETPLEDQRPYLLNYMKLGGNPLRLLEDLAQARLMWTLRVKIDAWSVGLDERIRARNRHLLNAAYLRCSSQRVWLYVKYVKYFLTVGPNGRIEDDSDDSRIMESICGGGAGEDAIAKAHNLFGENRESLNELIFKTAMNEVDLKQSPGLDLWKPVTLPLQEIRRRIVFKMPGSICSCGLPIIEEFAIVMQMKMLEDGILDAEWLGNLAFDIEDIFELRTRAVLRAGLPKVLEGELDVADLHDFLKVFFEATYPTPPISMLDAVGSRIPIQTQTISYDTDRMIREPRKGWSLGR
ncbi:hypothetical protein BJ170DRAFT_724254 [Xylariales sp. AK1849]|nr:hypothetical protein BJ170DRAFT_724254 [Xylariales sp. AK1849]